jgi:plastocyanin
MKRQTIIVIAAIIVIVIVVIAATSLLNQPNGASSNNSSESPSKTNSVTIMDLAFGPTPLTVSVGTTVTWTNDDSTTHTLTSTTGPGSFVSGKLAPGSTFSHTFDQACTYDYMCTIHSTMHG